MIRWSCVAADAVADQPHGSENRGRPRHVKLHADLACNRHQRAILGVTASGCCRSQTSFLLHEVKEVTVLQVTQETKRCWRRRREIHRRQQLPTRSNLLSCVSFPLFNQNESDCHWKSLFEGKKTNRNRETCCKPRIQKKNRKQKLYISDPSVKKERDLKHWFYKWWKINLTICFLIIYFSFIIYLFFSNF